MKQNFHDFIGLLLQRENVRARKDAKKLEITYLKQTGNIEDYIANFQEIASQTDFKEEDLIVFFRNGYSLSRIIEEAKMSLIRLIIRGNGLERTSSRKT